MPKYVTFLIVFVVVGALAYAFANRESPNLRSLVTPSVSVDELLKSAGEYDGEVVKVSGIVTGSVGLMGFGGFRLQDSVTKSEIMVMASEGIPLDGTVISLKGKFKQAVVIGNYRYAVLVQNSK